MLVKKQIVVVLEQLSSLLQLLSDEVYQSPSSLLNDHSIGAHSRHIIELFQCLLDGYNVETIQYAQRKRDKKIEWDRLFAVTLLKKIEVEMNKPNKPLVLEEMDSSTENNSIMIHTNYDRELLYNLEHAIHHMAFIRIAVQEKSNIVLPENFGVASSTTKYKQTCAQ